MDQNARPVLDLTQHLTRQGIRLYSVLGWPVMVALAVGLPALTFALGVVVVVALPGDYFIRRPVRRGFWHSHRALRFTLAALKNVLGATVLLAGFVMALPLVPGPGLVFMLVGLGMIDFPGKRALEQRFLRQPRVLSSVNKMRARFGKPPMQVLDGNVVDSGP